MIYTCKERKDNMLNTCRWHSRLCICCTNEHFKKIPPIHICSIIKYSDTLLQHHFMYKQVIWKSEIQQRGVHLVGMGIDFEFSDQFQCNNIYEKYSATEYTFIPKNCKEFFWSVTTTLNAKYLFKSTSVASSFFYWQNNLACTNNLFWKCGYWHLLFVSNSLKHRSYFLSGL